MLVLQLGKSLVGGVYPHLFHFLGVICQHTPPHTIVPFVRISRRARLVSQCFFPSFRPLLHLFHQEVPQIIWVIPIPRLINLYDPQWTTSHNSTSFQWMLARRCIPSWNITKILNSSNSGPMFKEIWWPWAAKSYASSSRGIATWCGAGAPSGPCRPLWQSQMSLVNPGCHKPTIWVRCLLSIYVYTRDDRDG